MSAAVSGPLPRPTPGAERQGGRLALASTAVLLLSYSVLTFEVALTRIFSVMLSYHFVFAIVATALAGLGAGALLLPRWRRAFPAQGSRLAALVFASLVVISVLWLVLLPVWASDSRAKVWLYLFLAALPFFAAGLAISATFQRFADRGSVLYAADLAGAAAGALTVVPLLDLLGPGVVFVAATAAALAAVLLGFSEVKVPVLPLSTLAVLAGMTALLWSLGIQLPVPIANDPDKDMYRLMSNAAAGARIVESRWSSFGRTDLVSNKIEPDEMTLFVDGGAGSAMYNLEAIVANPAEAARITLGFGGYFPFLLLEEAEQDNALVIGSGGGRDVLVALMGGVRSITAVEVNPDVVQLVRDYAEYNGGIYTGAPGVRAVVDEGRHFVRSTDERYDTIMLSIPVTKSSRSVEGYALTESYLFTVEAFEDYLDRLTPEGRIVVVAHSDAEIYRLISLAAAALGRRGITEQEALARIYTIASEVMPTLVVENRPLEPVRAERIHQYVEQLGFNEGNYYIPGGGPPPLRPGERLEIEGHWRMFDRQLAEVAAGRLSLADLVRTAPARIDPVTDDRPFFYNFDRGLPSPFGVFAVLILVALGLLVVVLARRPTGEPVTTFGRALRSSWEPRLFLLIFVSLGVGFMVVEIALFQKLMLYIGQPQRALSVLLAALLLGGGIGSQVSMWLRRNVERGVAVACLLSAALVVMISLLFPLVFRLGLDARVAAAFVLVPLGFAMGIPFPLSLRSAKARGLGAHVPSVWGVNGIASVLGSALAMIVGLTIGFSAALYLGAALYTGAALFALTLRRQVAAPQGTRVP